VVERSVTTGNATTRSRALEGRRTRIDSAVNLGPASLPGREIDFDHFRWLRCAPPPA